MWSYILRRSGYSILIVLGVVLLTFGLFNLAAGDPAAAVLGKNARPEEIEALRCELGGDLPVLYGHECRTESWIGAKFEPARPVAHFKRNFAAKNIVARVLLADGSRCEIPVADDARECTIALFAPVAAVEFCRRQSDPFNTQFRRALREICHFKPEFPYVEFFDFGCAITTREPIRGILARSMGPSLLLMLPIFLGELLFGLLFALVAVAFRDRWPDRLLVVLSVAGMSVSYLVVIIFGQWFFGYCCELFPLWGFESAANLGLPVMIGVLCGIGGNVRFYRTVFVDELRREYLRTARAKGASPLRVFGKHLLRNALIQIITRASATLPFLFTGSLLLESFFGVPGLGFAGVEALYNSDLQLLKALVVLSALLFVVINLLADLAYAWADRRIQLK